MSGSTSKVAIEVVANAAGVDKGLKRAERSLTAFETSTKRLGVGIQGALAGVAAGFSLGGFVSSINSAIERIDDIGDRAAGLDDSTANISRIQYAVERLGGSGEAVTGILAKMSRSLGQAALEGGPAADAIKALGLNIDALKQMQPSEAFIAIVDAISMVPSVYERAKLGQDIFGRGVTEINAVLKAGEGQMQSFMDRADMLGLTITESMAERGGAAKDAIGDLRGVLGAVVNTIAVELAPEITSIADKLGKMSGAMDSVAQSTRVVIDLAKDAERPFNVLAGLIKIASSSALGVASGAMNGGGLIDATASVYREGIAQVSDGILGASRPAENAAQRIEQSVESAGRGYDIAAEQIEAGNARIAESSEGAATAVGKVQAAVEAAQESAESRQNAANQRALMGGATPFDEFLAGILQPVLDGGVYSDATAEVLDQWDEFGAKLERDVMTPMEKYQEQIEDISDAYDLGVISVETYERAVSKAWDEMQSATEMDKPLGYTNLGMSGGVSQDGGGFDPMMDRFLQYNTLPGGFVGGSIPDNMRTFTPPEWGSRQVDYRSNYSDNVSAYGMDRNNSLLERIADGVENAGMVA